MPTLVIGLTGLLILAGCVGVPRDGSADEKGIIQHEMLKAAQAGRNSSLLLPAIITKHLSSVASISSGSSTTCTCAKYRSPTFPADISTRRKLPPGSAGPVACRERSSRLPELNGSFDRHGDRSWLRAAGSIYRTQIDGASEQIGVGRMREWMENLSFSGGVVVGFVAAVLIASLWWTYGWATGGSSTDVAYSQIASIRTHGVPEGPDDALTYSQTPSERSLPIDLIESHIPQPLPATLDQGIRSDTAEN